MKSKYLQELSERRKQSVEKVEGNKADALIDRVLGRNKVFVRDYSVFAVGPRSGKGLLRRNENARYGKGSFLYMRPDIKMEVKSRTEVEDPGRFEKCKNYKEDGFARMYKQICLRNKNIQNNEKKYIYDNNSVIHSYNNINAKLFNNGKLQQVHLKQKNMNNSYFAKIAQGMIITSSN